MAGRGHAGPAAAAATAAATATSRTERIPKDLRISSTLYSREMWGEGRARERQARKPGRPNGVLAMQGEPRPVVAARLCRSHQAFTEVVQLAGACRHERGVTWGPDYAPSERLKLVPERVLAGLYLDLGHRIRDTTLVVGTGRSGSTWLAEIINHRNEYRLVFEPFRGDRVRKARPFRRGHFIEPSEQDHPLRATIDALVAGRVRSWWTDRHNHRRLATRRIVKEVRITNLLPWIRLSISGSSDRLHRP